ncbi:MAG TPA: penicillin acylase family protein, partial [Actinomycetota bacterium]|nr:penicillin acylase family protein [Actinomycetota bacterium]
LDGSRSRCDWATDEDAIEPGLFGPSHLPWLKRRDYVTNSNDSYWLSNPHQPLEGFSRIIGDERTARSLRTRIGLIMTESRILGQDERGTRGFVRKDMQSEVFRDWSYAGMLTRDDLVRMCRQFEILGFAPTSSGLPVRVGTACDVLAGWDLKENLDSKGAILFRQFWDRASAAMPSPYRHPFDPSDPVHTPYGLDTTNPIVRLALGDAIADLSGADIPLDAAVGAVQGVTRNGRFIPIHGGTGDPHGDFNAIDAEFDPGQGFADVDYGSSFIQVVTWRDGDSCLDAATILTYSLSGNPRSSHFADQTLLFSMKRWVTERFCEADIKASPALRVTHLTQ